ncbi:MAG: hypothetical protein JWN76_1667 [Chitinophagaceae bacterium]|nr:hypothetical protein [Chitinophagaceae bacterium]
MTEPPVLFEKKNLNISSRGIELKGTLFSPVKSKNNSIIVIAHGAQDPTRKNWVSLLCLPAGRLWVLSLYFRSTR